MRPILETISLQDARAILLDAAAPIDRVERIDLREANGRVIASSVVSTLDVPPFDRAAMDGYAVIAEDTFGAGSEAAKTLRCVDTVHTGRVSSRRIGRGECVEIATGAPVPDGADAVVMVEHTERAGLDDVRVLAPVYPRQHVSRRGTDIATGQALISAGDTINPSKIGALAAVGLTEIDAYARPTVAIVSTGNEIVDPGRPLLPGQIYDINRFTLSSIIEAHGGVAVAHPSVADDLEDLTAALAATRHDDVVVFSGGSSVGDRDLMTDLIGRSGEILFHGIALKPGKPTMLGRIGGRPIIGMPGNPTSCLSNAYLLLVPMLRKIARLPEYQPHRVTLPLARRIVSTTGRHQFYTVRVVDGTAVPAFKASGDITSMSRADGYIEIPAQTDIVEAGELVEVKLF
jgi:molybdopterin molybdotransferase